MRLRAILLATGSVLALAAAGCTVDCKVCCADTTDPTSEYCYTVTDVDKSVCDDCSFDTDNGSYRESSSGTTATYSEACDCSEL
jgi:hypothetical protein